MFLADHLQKIGLTEKEAKIYLAALQLGGDKVQEIAVKAGLKRSTAYVILDELKQKGLIFHEKKPGADIYVAVNPDALKHMMDDRKKSLDEALPFLRAMHAGEKSKPQVQVFEGVEGMKHIYLDTLWKSKGEILFFSSIKKIYEVFPNILDEWLTDKTGQRAKNRRTRELINPETVDIEYGQKSIADNPNTQIRVIAKDERHQFWATDNAIVDDKIMMVSLEGKLFTTVIQNNVLADTMRTLYELAWQSALPIEEYVKATKKQ